MKRHTIGMHAPRFFEKKAVIRVDRHRIAEDVTSVEAAAPGGCTPFCG